METIVENENWHAFKIDPREKLQPQYQNYLAHWIHANQGSADTCALDFTNFISNLTLSNCWALFIKAEAVVVCQQGQTFGNDQMKLCLTKFDNQTFVSTGLYALNPKGREYNEVLEKLLKEQKESKGYARQRYDQGMGNRGEVFMTWEGFEPGTWSLELWDPKQFKLGTLLLIMWMMTSAREHCGWTLWEMEECGRMGQKKGVLGKGEFIVLCCLY